MSNEITIVAPQNIEESERLSTTLAKSSLLPEALRGKPGDILATLLAGAELGLAPMQSLRGIVIIKGKPTLAADLMGALCKRRKDICEYLTLSESSSTRAVYRTKRAGEPEPTTIAFTIEDAKAAGLVGAGGMYTKYPRQMLRARCLAEICRAVYPDLCMGLYDPEELGAPAEMPADIQPEPPPKETELNPAPVTGARTANIKAQLAAKTARAPKEERPARSMVVDVAPGETEQDAEKRQTKELVVWPLVQGLMARHGKAGAEAAAFIKETTGKSDRKALVMTDYAALCVALEGPLPSDEDAPPGVG